MKFQRSYFREDNYSSGFLPTKNHAQVLSYRALDTMLNIFVIALSKIDKYVNNLETDNKFIVI